MSCSYPGAVSTPEVAAKLHKGIAESEEAAEAAEVSLTVLNIHKDREAEQLQAALTSRQWDGVVFGGGLRGDHMMEVLERVVHCVRQHAPDTLIMFNAGPRDTLNCVKRYWPNINYTPPPPNEDKK